MKKCIISCWYGDWPNYFQLFLDSCKNNLNWDWIIFTDNFTDRYVIPLNVYVVRLGFDDLIELVQSKFSFRIALREPYKVCDYRPAYGYIFSEYLNDYDYWGHCDLDVIWGQLDCFYPDELIITYDKFLSSGHLALYKNTNSMNTMFMNPISYHVDYKVIYSSNYNWGFDETGRYSITTILNGNPEYQVFYDKKNIADICPYGEKFGIYVGGGIQRVEAIKINTGSVFVLFSTGERKEKAYVHLQKRKIGNMDSKISSEYYIYGNSIRNEVRFDDSTVVVKKPGKASLRINQFMRGLDIIKCNLKSFILLNKRK